MTSDLAGRRLRILYIEDSLEDYEILVGHLQVAGLEVEALRVATAEGMSKALEEKSWDLVLSDWDLPSFDGLKALGILQQSGTDIPFILISGAISEEMAVTVLKAGAHDFITKTRLYRLVPAIERELREAEERRRHREANQRLEELGERLQAISAAAHDAIVMLDPGSCITFWNPAAERIFGFPVQEALGKFLGDLVIPGHSRGLFATGLSQLGEEGEDPGCGGTLELMGMNREGREFPIELSLSTVMLGGQPHVVGILRDISERKALERARVDQIRMLQSLIDTIPNPIYYKDTEGRYLGLNQAFATLRGVNREDLIGKTVFEVSQPDLAKIYHDSDQKLIEEPGVHVYEGQVDSADGSLRDTINSKATFYDAEGNVAGVVGTILDITERKHGERERARLEVELRQAQKLEAIGQLAAGIAHEINTPIQFVGDNTIFLRDTFSELLVFIQWLGKRLTDETAGPPSCPEVLERVKSLDIDYLSEEIPKAIAQSLDGISRVSKIVRAMKDFSHPGSESKVQVDLNRSIESTLTVSRNEWKYVAELETDFDPNLPLVPCYPAEFNQVILNLVVNAAHAIEEVMGGGHTGRKGLIRVTTRQMDGEAEIRITDTGTGIPEAIRDRIFDPFFTTKGVGKGTGQGLAIAHSVVVDKLGGCIQVDSEVGRGTTFILHLPLNPSEEEG